MLTRRQMLLGSAALAWLPAGCARSRPAAGEAVVNDIHSRLNATRVAQVVVPPGADALPDLVRRARAGGYAISVAGGRHAMGGQQFGAGTLVEFLRAKRRWDPEERFQSGWYRHYRAMLADAL